MKGTKVFSFFGAMALLATGLGTQPVMANDLTSGTVVGRCTSYFVSANASNLDADLAVLYSAKYIVTLSGCVVTPTTVKGSFAIGRVGDAVAGIGYGDKTAFWDPSLTLKGTCQVSGTATLIQNASSMVTLTPYPSPSGTFSCPEGQCSGSIGDFIWNDLNRNGIQDAGEPGIDGVTVQLRNASGTVIQTTYTVTKDGKSGYYQFTGLCKGNYTVMIVSTTVPSGYTATGCGVGGDGSVDSNCDGSVTLETDSASNQTIDFGYQSAAPTCAGTIGDFVWNDLNRNGIQDSGEPGISGVAVGLTGPSGPKTTSTDANGRYQFSGLCKGSYLVIINTPSGLAQTQCTAAGSTTANDSNCDGNVTLPADNSSDPTIDFGFYPLGKTFSIGPSSMEGHLTMTKGDWVSGGYSFKFKSGGHAATNFAVTSTVTVPVTCPKGGGAGGNIVVDLGTKTYAVAAGNTDWLPTGDQNSVLSWMGAARAPDLCNGYPMDNAKGAIYTATVSQNPASGSLVDFRFKYRDPNAKGKGDVNCTDTSDPRRAKADVCGASWSQTVTDP
jgi:hypothetical protein